MLSQGYYDAYYLQAQRLRRMIADDFQAAFTQQCDVIMGPVTPTVAKPIGDNPDDPTADWLADIYTLGLNLAGLPGMSVPCGFGQSAAGKPLPIGLQIAGRPFDEATVLKVAAAYERTHDWVNQYPPL